MKKSEKSKKSWSKKKGTSRYAGVRWYLKDDGTKSYNFVYYDRGDKKHRHVGGFQTAVEARDARDDAIRDCRKFGVHQNRRLVKELAADWPQSHRGTRRVSTMQAYRHGLRPFLAKFGDRRLRDLSRGECREWGRNQMPWALSPAKIFLTDLQGDGHIPENFLLGVKLPAAPGRANYPSLSTAQVWNLIEISQRVLPRNVGSQIAGLIATSAFLGTRLGETLVLGGAALNFEKSVVDITKQGTLAGVFTPPKRGPRQSALSPYLLDAWKKLEVELERVPMFSPPTTRYFTATNFYRSWEKVVAASGIPGLDFHELRHYHQTWLTYLGVHPWAINDHIGHAGPGTTEMKRYNHLSKMGYRPINEALSADAEPLEPEDDRAEFVPEKVLQEKRSQL